MASLEDPFSQGSSRTLVTSTTAVLSAVEAWTAGSPSSLAPPVPQQDGGNRAQQCQLLEQAAAKKTEAKAFQSVRAVARIFTGKVTGWLKFT